MSRGGGIRKVLGWSVIAIAVLILLAVVQAVRSVPAPSEIRSGLQTALAEKERKRPAPAVEKGVPGPEGAAPFGKEEAPAAPAKGSEDLKEARAFAEELMDESKPRMRLCGALADGERSPLHERNRGAKLDFQEYTIDLLLEGRVDPFLETLMPLLRQSTRGPAMRSVLETIMDAKERGDEGFLDRLEFAGKLLSAARELRASVPELNRLADRGYQGFVLNKILEKRPQLAEDPDAGALCRSIEAGANSSGEIDYAAEAKRIEGLIAKAGLRASDVAFDPTYRSNLKVGVTSKGVQVGAEGSAGWISELLGRGGMKPAPNPDGQTVVAE